MDGMGRVWMSSDSTGEIWILERDSGGGDEGSGDGGKENVAGRNRVGGWVLWSVFAVVVRFWVVW